MLRNVLFLDVETNGRDVRLHDLWDFAWWNLTTGEAGGSQVNPRDWKSFMADGELRAFQMNRFVDRFTYVPRADAEKALNDFVAQVYGDTDKPAVIVGSNPAFDMRFMSKALIGIGFEDSEPWHYHPIDIGSYAAGVLGLDTTDPVSQRRVAETLGIETGDHTAAGDVTCGGRCFLVLREAAKLANEQGVRPAEWIKAQPLRGAAIERELIERPPTPATETGRATRYTTNTATGGTW